MKDAAGSPITARRARSSIRFRAYGTSTVKAMTARTRSTNAQIEALEDAVYQVARAEHPVTVRGVFYRVMSMGLVPKSEAGYRQVQQRVLRMRRARRLPYGWISDGSRVRLKPPSYESVKDCLTQTAQVYRRALWSDQAVHLEIWTEKDALRGVILPVTTEFDVPLMVARGFASESFLWNTAEVISDDDMPAVIYQLGDHDPSGVSAWEHIQRKLREFVPDTIDLVFERLAVTPEQIEEYDLPTRPTKQTDTRAAAFEGESVEVDAMSSLVLRDLVRDAIEYYIDDNALEITKVAERSEREILERMSNYKIAG